VIQKTAISIPFLEVIRKLVRFAVTVTIARRRNVAGDKGMTDLTSGKPNAISNKEEIASNS
jgi:hypothetical protein